MVDTKTSETEAVSGTGKPPGDVTASPTTGVASRSAHASILPVRTIKNLSPKLVWIQLNSGQHEAIPAGQTKQVLESDLKENSAFAKLVALQLVADVGASAAKDPKG